MGIKFGILCIMFYFLSLFFVVLHKRVKYHLWLYQTISDVQYCHTRHILDFQLICNSGKSQLARWAMKWHYNQSDQPTSQPSIRLLIQIGISQQLIIGSSSNLKLKHRGLSQNLKSLNKDDIQWKITSKC